MDQPVKILACDPGAAYRARRGEIDQAIHRVLDSGWYILGREVEAFESEFAAYLGVAHVIGVGNGTDSIHLALRACGIGPGDVVITVSHTAVATVAGIELSGATPVLVDIDPASFTMDPQSLEDALRACASDPRLARAVKAVLPVHLYGQPADMTAILGIARRRGLRVIEDCAQSHGAAIGGSKTGALADLGVFSCYPTKNLGALGDGGIVATNDPVLAERVRQLREYGWRQRNHSEIAGLNSRLDELQAAVLRVRLGDLDKGNAARRTIARIYDRAFSGSQLIPPAQVLGFYSVFHQYVVRAADRNDLRARLRDEGIQTLIHYPEAVHQQPAYQDRLPRVVSLDRTEAAVREILSLPIYPELPLPSVDLVAQAALHLAAKLG